MYYTREQLVSAMQKYNEACIDKPNEFTPINKSVEGAEAQTDYLLSLVDSGVKNVFTENEIQRLQSKVHAITGDGEVMGLFNEMLGISAG